MTKSWFLIGKGGDEPLVTTISLFHKPYPIPGFLLPTPMEIRERK